MVMEEGTSYRFPMMKIGTNSSFSFFSTSMVSSSDRKADSVLYLRALALIQSALKG
jgi:hypothetical protein